MEFAEALRNEDTSRILRALLFYFCVVLPATSALGPGGKCIACFTSLLSNVMTSKGRYSSSILTSRAARTSSLHAYTGVPTRLPAALRGTLRNSASFICDWVWLLLHRPLRAADEERLFCLVAYTHIVYDTKAKLIMYMGLAAASTVLLLSLLHRDLHAPRV